MQAITNLQLPKKYHNHIKHFTASGYVLNKKKTKVLLIKHKKLNKWLPPGGHVEQGELPHETLLRELEEETGVKAKFISYGLTVQFDRKKEWMMPSPYFTMLQLIPKNPKEKEHLHYDFNYILIAENDIKTPDPHESQNIGWFSLKEVLSLDAFTVVPEICKSILST